MYARLDLIKSSLCTAKCSGAVFSFRMKNFLKKIYVCNISMHEYIYTFARGFGLFGWFCLGFFFQKHTKST